MGVIASIFFPKDINFEENYLLRIKSTCAELPPNCVNDTLKLNELCIMTDAYILSKQVFDSTRTYHNYLEIEHNWENLKKKLLYVYGQRFREIKDDYFGDNLHDFLKFEEELLDALKNEVKDKNAGICTLVDKRCA